MNEADSKMVPCEDSRCIPEQNEYLKIFQSQACIKDNLSLDSIGTLFNNVDHLHKTLGHSLHSLTAGTVVFNVLLIRCQVFAGLYRKSINQNNTVQKW